MTGEPGGGEFDNNNQGDPFESPTADWVTPPKDVNDISKVPVHKLQKAFDERGTQVDMGKINPNDGTIPAKVNRIVLTGVPKRHWYNPFSWFKK